MADDYRFSFEFPNLLNHYKKKSQNSTQYNCIAWAAGESHRHWWPNEGTEVYWPLDLTFEEDVDCRLENFIQAFELLGYECCEGQAREKGYQKVAIYCKDGKPTHAARQLWRGSWVSKLGTRNIDIEHETNKLLEDGLYGKVAQVMRRPWTARNLVKSVLLSLKVRILGIVRRNE